MSTSREDRLVELRRAAFPYLQGSDFDDALKAARDYHKTHPPAELIKEPRVMLRSRAAQHLMTEVHQDTLEKLYVEHRSTLIGMLRVPPDLAEKIVDELILADTTAPPAD